MEAAHTAVKSTEKQPYYRLKYERLMKRRGKKCAVVAIARMILTAIFAMLQTGEVFNPSDLDRFDMPENLRRKRLLSSAKEADSLSLFRMALYWRVHFFETFIRLPAFLSCRPRWRLALLCLFTGLLYFLRSFIVFTVFSSSSSLCSRSVFDTSHQ